MDLGEKDIKKISILFLIGVLALLSFLVIKPFILSIVAAFLLSYLFLPVHKKINSYVRNPSVSASIVVTIIVLSLLALSWLLFPLLIRQAFEMFLSLQKIDMHAIVATVFPTASEDFSVQLATTLNSVIGKAFSAGTNALSEFLTDLPRVLVNFFILGFLFFFGLRDSDKIAKFAKDLSPLNETKEKIVVKHFKDMTGAVIYGWVIVGIIQGILAGIGLFLFGIPNALTLTIIAIFLSIIPFLGPAFVWVPVEIYLLTSGNTPLAIGFLVYNLIVVSLVDNVLRSYIISRKTNLHSGVILVGMLGGLFVFGTVGLIVGPLILAYLLTLLESFKDKSIYSLFS